MRTIPRGGAEITEMIAGRLGMALPEAESLKCQVGLRADAEPGTAQVIREAVGPVINEIRSSFAYLNAGGLNAGGRQARVARLALSGGGCLLPGLPDALSTQLGVPVVFADPTIRLSGWRRARRDAFEGVHSSAAVSIGLALGAA